MLFVIDRDLPRGLAVRRLPRMQEVVASNPTEVKILFFTITLIRVKCEELFCKTNIKFLKLILQKLAGVNYKSC